MVKELVMGIIIWFIYLWPYMFVECVLTLPFMRDGCFAAANERASDKADRHVKKMEEREKERKEDRTDEAETGGESTLTNEDAAQKTIALPNQAKRSQGGTSSLEYLKNALPDGE